VSKTAGSFESRRKILALKARCICNHGWVCEDHPDQPWDHDDCGAPRAVQKTPDCNKNPDLIFALVYRSRTTKAAKRDNASQSAL